MCVYLIGKTWQSSYMLFCRLHNIRQENSDSEGGQSKSERRYGFFVGMLYNEIFKTTEKGVGNILQGFFEDI